MSPIRRHSLLLLCCLLSALAQAQSPSKRPLDTRVNILFGLIQPIAAKGFNFEVDFFYKRLALDFSHGLSLDFSGNAVSGEVARQQLAVHVPYTTGFGIGYRFTEAFSARIEPKWHQFQLYYDGETQTADNRIVQYNTFSLGIGLYYCWLPFKSKNNALRGIMIAPSVRYWPTLSSTLENDQFVYYNKVTNQEETHERMQPGIGNTPWVINVSVGYSFAWKKN